MHAAAAPPLEVFSILAVQGALSEMTSLIRKSAGVPVTMAFAATVPLDERLQKGEAAMAGQQTCELRFSGAGNIVRLPDELQDLLTITVAVLRPGPRAEAAIEVRLPAEAVPVYQLRLQQVPTT